VLHRLKTIRQYFEFLLVMVVGEICRFLSPDNAVALGRLLGQVGYFLAFRRRPVALANLRLCYGAGVSPIERARLVQRVYEHLGMTFTECFLLPGWIESGLFDRRVTIEGEEILRDALRQGKGVIVVTGHIGNWEVVGFAVSRTLGRVVSVGKPLSNHLLDSYLRKLRNRAGQELVPTDGAVGAMIKELQQGGVVGLLVDQRASHGGATLRFFGIEASTHTTPAALALKYGSPIVILYDRRIGRRFRHRIKVLDPILPEAGTREESLLRTSQRINDTLEAIIRAEPDQWLWVYSRWKKKRPRRRSGSRAPSVSK